MIPSALSHPPVARRPARVAVRGLALSTALASTVLASAVFACPAQAADASLARSGSVHTAPVRRVAPTISDVTLPTAVIGVKYVQSIHATGDGPLQFTTSDPLPPGITLFATGSLVGTPTATTMTSYTFSVTVAGKGGIASAKITVPVRAAALPSIDPATFPAVSVGTFFSQKVVATGDGPLTFETLDPLPPGLAIHSDGLIYGTPTLTAMSSYAVRVRVTSSLVMANATAIITIPIANPSSVPVITSGAPGAAVVGTPYSFQLAASGVPAPTFAVVGTLPAWLRLDAATGVLSGTPTEIGRSTFSVVATNAAGTSAAVPLTIVVAAASVVPTIPPTVGGAGEGGATTPTGGATTPTGGSVLLGRTAGINGTHLAETGAGEASWVGAVLASLLIGSGVALGPIVQRKRRRAGA